jgi:hypothetical protein
MMVVDAVKPFETGDDNHHGIAITIAFATIAFLIITFLLVLVITNQCHRHSDAEDVDDLHRRHRHRVLAVESIPNDAHIIAPQPTAKEDGLRQKDLEWIGDER